MALLNNFLAGLNCPVTTLVKRYLEDGIPEDLQSLTHCAPSDWCLKSSSKSSELRDRGNDAYRSEKYDEGLKYYSQSIAAAPTDSTELALAYGNRSAILQVRKEYELCILDTNRALDGLIPQSSRMELLERKAKCWEKLQEQNEMRAELVPGLPDLTCSSPEREILMACERLSCGISELGIDDTDLVTGYTRNDGAVQFEAKLKNVMPEYLSPIVERRVGEGGGQVLFAAVDIEPGEILSIGGLYALVVHEVNQQEYCSYCSVPCTALIPCVSCSQDMYCCVGCREKAYDTYHKTECKLLPLWGNVSPFKRQQRRLFLRIFLTGTMQGSNLTYLLNDPEVYAALVGDLDHVVERYSSKDYLLILNTCWKLDDVADAAKQRQRMQEVLEIFAGLRYVRYFGADGEIETQCSGNTLTGRELLAIVLLAHNISIGMTQYHHIAARIWEPDKGKPLIWRRHEIGTAVGPWHTFLNHSCHPNAAKLASRGRVLCRSVKPIKAGEQIFQSDGMSHAVDTPENREAETKRLWGEECSCVVCVEDWPFLDASLTYRNGYRTTDRAEIKKIEKMQKWVLHEFQRALADRDVKKIIECCKLVRERTNELAESMILFENFLRRLMKAKEN